MVDYFKLSVLKSSLRPLTCNFIGLLLLNSYTELMEAAILPIMPSCTEETNAAKDAITCLGTTYQGSECSIASCS